MPTKKRRRGVSKAEWQEAGLQAISERGIDSLTIEGLARSLGINKSGFYWHFKNRDDLLRQLLKYWTHEITEVISENPEILKVEPRQRLVTIAEMILDYDLNRYELGIRHWAMQDAGAAMAVEKVNQLRLDFIGKAFSELGFSGDDLEMRTMLFVGYHSGESIIFREISQKRLRKLINKRIDLLTSK
jgi:AcrR family transcriptional regulator